MSVSNIRVLIVDDSVLVRTLLTDILNNAPDIEVVGAAKDPYEAREMIKTLQPDVLTLDIEMPKMNGITFLSNLMRLRPMPVVMISTLTQVGAPATLEALELGAIDFLPKPSDRGEASLVHYSDQIVDKVRAAASANLSALDSPKSASPPLVNIKNRQLKPNVICAIGASTGGTEAIKDVLVQMPEQCPPLVLAQHIPPTFSTSFAERLNRLCAIDVFEAEHNQPIKPGCAYLAPGDRHLTIKKSSFGYVCQLVDGPLVNRHKPSVEVLFDSVLKVAGKHAIGVILTGMGADGSHKLLELRQAGCLTLAQDKATSVVWGMPGVAVDIGAAVKVLPLQKMAGTILNASFV